MKPNRILFFLFVVLPIWTGTLRVSGTEITIDSPKNNFVPIAIPTNIVGGNSLTNLFPNAAWGTSLIRTRPYGYDTRTLDPDLGEWTEPSPLVAGGVYWLFSPANVSQTFTWQISGLPANVKPPILVSNTYYFVGAINAGTNYEDIVGGPPTNDTALLRLLPGSGPWSPLLVDPYVYFNGSWSPATPTIRPGEGVLIVQPALRLTSTPVTNAPAGFILSWPRGRLLASDNLDGPWQPLTNTPPFRVNTEIQPASTKFYQVEELVQGGTFGYPYGAPWETP